MASAGPNSPGTVVNDSSYGYWEWVNPANAVSSNNSYAICYCDNGETNYLKATGFGFAIPSGATINGVLVEVEGKGGAMQRGDSHVQLVKAGSRAGTAITFPSDLSASDTTKSFGGASSLWGTTLSDSDVNSNSFGCALTVYSIGDYNQFDIDHIKITVTYTEGGGGASAVPVIMNQYRQRQA